MTSTFNASTAIAAALVSLKPTVPSIPEFHSPRSGLPVVLGAGVKSERGTKHAGQSFVPVKIDGTVDYMDAEHLATFFTELAAALKTADKK